MLKFWVRLVSFRFVVKVDPVQFPDEEYPVFVISILNKIRSEYIINKMLDVIETSIKQQSST